MGRGRLLLRLGARHAVRAGARARRPARAARARARVRSARTAASRSRSSGRTSREVEQALQEAKIRFEAIHRYELDDDGQATGVVPAMPSWRSDGMRLSPAGGWSSLAFVPRFVAAFAAIGAVSRARRRRPPRRPSPRPAPARRAVVPWYWTMAVSPSDPNVLVLGDEQAASTAPSDGGKTWQAVGPEGHPRDEPRRSPATRSSRAACRLGQPTRTRSSGRARRAPPPDGPAVRRRRAPTTARPGRTLHPNGLPNVTVQSLAADPGASDSTLYALLNERQALPLDRRRALVQARVPEARDPAVGDRGHAGRRLRRRRHGHRRRTRARTRRSGSATPFKDTKGGRW